MTTFNFEKVNNMVKAYNGKSVGFIINLTQHQMVQEQYNFNDIELYEVQFKGHEKEAREDIIEALSFNELPTKGEIESRAKTLSTIAVATLNQARDLSELDAKFYALGGEAMWEMVEWQYIMIYCNSRTDKEKNDLIELVNKAIEKAKSEYKIYHVKTISPVEQEYLDALKELNNKIKKNDKK